MIRHFINLLLWLLPRSRLFGLRRGCLRAMGIDMHEGSEMCGGGWVYGRGRLTIGRGSWVSPGTIFYTHEDAAIMVGAGCDIGPFVRVLTGGHEIGPGERRAGPGTARPVAIGDGCWIGASTTILGGVTIGAGTIVAAGSIVAQDVPPNVLAAGVPAVTRRVLE